MNTKERIKVIRKMVQELQSIGNDGKQPSKDEADLALEITATLDRFEAKAKPHDTRSDEEKWGDLEQKAYKDKINKQPPDVRGLS